MRIGSVATIAFAIVLAGSSARAQLCSPSANPCVVSANLVVPSGTIADIGTRDLVIAANKTLTVSGAGLLLIRARNVTLEADSKIVAGGQDGFGGDVIIEATGPVWMKTGSRIDVQSAFGGSIDVSGASFQLDGQLRGSATARDGDGGIVSVLTTGNTTLAGQGIQNNGGDRFASGGLVDVIAGGNIVVSATIAAKGGDGDGGDIDLDAAGDLTTTFAGELVSFATWPFGSGGATTLTAGGSVTVGGSILARGQGDFFEGGGDGGDLDIIADGGDVRINATVELDGSAPDGSGGFLDVFAVGRVEFNAPVSLTSGREGGGGDVLVTGQDVLVNAPLTLQAGFIGGAVDVFADGDVTFAASGDVDVSTSGGAFGEFGGLIDVYGCSVDVQAGAQLLAVGNGSQPRASIRLRGVHALRIAGVVQAGAYVELRYKDALPVFVPGFLVSPTPTQIFTPTFPCCFACSTTTTVVGSTTTTTTIVSQGCGDGIVGPGEVCDDGNPFDGDCCSSTCQFEPAGQPCQDDGNPCTSSFCTGLGVCHHAGDNPGVLCRAATHACDVAETCTGFSATCPADAVLPDDSPCDDDACLDGQTCSGGVCGGGVEVTCPACESCDPAVGCRAAPRPTCRQTIAARKSTLVLKDSATDAKDKLVWKWAKGQTTELADYGDPTTVDAFELCLFDETSGEPVVVGSARLPAGGTCPDRPCWRATSTGYKYANKLGTPDGLTKLQLRAGPDGGSVAIAKGKGEALSTPALPLGTATRVQLRGADACWEATFSPAGTKRNDSAVFKGLSD